MNELSTRPARCLAFVDLDDTLFSSARKQGDTQGLVPAALLRTGDVVSYSNPAQRGLQSMLAGAQEVIPVTARSLEAYRRVLLKFAGRAIVSYGATILLPEGGVDCEWARRVAPLLAAARAPLESLVTRVAAACDPQLTGLQTRLMHDGGDPTYVVVRPAGSDASVVHEAGLTVVADWLAQHEGFKLHVNGRILAVIPPGLGKAAAVAYLIEHERRLHGTLFTLGAGDSLTDLDFMRLCDLAIVPARTQLAQALTDAAAQGRERQRQQLASGRFGNGHFGP
jgi:predicted mannosyl-3-phosphoglycerate phosphatase (HAD superfamily)